MDTNNQFTVFALCIFVGFVGGVVYEVFAFGRFLLGCPRGKNKILGVAFDILFFITFACVCTAFAYAFRFPDFRVYIWLGYLVGGILYLKTLHQIVAFFENMCYNGINKLIKKAKNREKTLSKEVDEKV
ncbi:MAG: spore cortex biosynthesis protein YabQ [Clostridia bacterium]|nr:spore cortex biosynthesis protein YabQ [Clostridia bacterium]